MQQRYLLVPLIDTIELVKEREVIFNSPPTTTKSYSRLGRSAALLYRTQETPLNRAMGTSARTLALKRNSTTVELLSLARLLLF